MWLVRVLIFILYYGRTSASKQHYKMQNKYFSSGFNKWPNSLSWGSVRIFLGGYLYAVTQHLLTRRNFLFLNSLKGFWRSPAEISLFICFTDSFLNPNLKTWLPTNRCPFPFHLQGWMPASSSQTFLQSRSATSVLPPPSFSWCRSLWCRDCQVTLESDRAV